MQSKGAAAGAHGVRQRQRDGQTTALLMGKAVLRPTSAAAVWLLLLLRRRRLRRLLVLRVD